MQRARHAPCILTTRFIHYSNHARARIPAVLEKRYSDFVVARARIETRTQLRPIYRIINVSRCARGRAYDCLIVGKNVRAPKNRTNFCFFFLFFFRHRIGFRRVCTEITASLYIYKKVFREKNKFDKLPRVFTLSPPSF